MPDFAGFAGNSLLAQGGGWEPHRKSNFVAIIYGVGDGDLALSLKDSNVPAHSIEPQNVKYFNETMKYAGSVTAVEDWTMNYRNFMDRQHIKLLGAWASEVFNHATGGIGMAADYKRTGEIKALGPSGQDLGTVWELKGVWIKSITPEGFDHEDAGTPQMVAFALSVDRVIHVGMSS